MHRSTVFLTMLALTVGVPATYARQHEGHEGAAPPEQANARVAQCAQVQGLVTTTLEAALKRLEEARLTNSPAVLRLAADDVGTALLDVRARLEPCGKMATSAGPHAGHGLPNVQQAPPAAPPAPTVPAPGAGASQAPAPAAADPHAGHAAPSGVVPPRPVAPPSSAPRSPTQAPKPAIPPAGSSAPADSHAGHAAAAAPDNTPAAPVTNAATGTTPATSLAQLKCRNQVDPKTVPRMLYQGRTFYFCTESDRAEFAKDPGKYVKAPAQSAPAHAH